MNSEDAVKDTPDEDLEDGEIEDDDEDEVPPPAVALEAEGHLPAGQGVTSPPVRDRTHREQRSEERDRPPPGEGKHKKKHLTEAEKSVMKLHKLERMEREKREKFRREQMHVPEPVDDYAVSLEKALAKVLKKDQKVSDGEEKLDEEVKRGKKRKKKEKHKKAKRNKQESPKNPEDDIERRSSDPDGRSEGESSDTESSTDKHELRKQHLKRELRRENAKSRRERRDRSRERQLENRQGFKKLRKRNVGICLYYLQGKCNDEHCQYSHDCVQPLKLELCKFYLLDCCAKGDKCLYMHSDFPCKYYHTGIPCPYGDDCKFAHGGPLPESVKQILFKHIETAPKEILGNFPRLSRENAHMMITQAQKNLELKKQKEKEEKDAVQGGNISNMVSNAMSGGGGNSLGNVGVGSVSNNEGFDGDGDRGQGQSDNLQQSEKKEKRNRRSRWQDPEPEKPAHPMLGFGLNQGGFKDQDMRISSNGDVDMRSLHNMASSTSIHPTDIVNPNIFTTKPPPILSQNLGLQGLNLLQMAGYNLNTHGMLNPILGTNADAMQQTTHTVDIEKYKMDAAAAAMKDNQEESKDVGSLGLGKDVDLRIPPPTIMSPTPSGGDTDIRQLNTAKADDPDDEDALQIVMDDEEPKRDDEGDKEQEQDEKFESKGSGNDPQVHRDDQQDDTYVLPKMQRDLFARIQHQQKLNTPGITDKDKEQDQNIDWYSDDDDDNKLTIEHDDDPVEDAPDQNKNHNEDNHKHDELKEEISDSPAEPPNIPNTGIGGLGDLSNFDIAEVSKLLSTIKENTKDPRSKPSDPRARDPRLARQSSLDEKPEPMTIYEQTPPPDRFSDSDSRIGRADVDLRVGMQMRALGNYTPASEIDASINAHPIMTWKVFIVEVPKPDYTGLKLSASDAHTSGDPRLRKIFRLSTEEKDSPASPGSSPKLSNPAPRVDPRRKKAMEAAEAAKADGPATYAQQLSMLQSSPFYQSLTSNQKVMLNQELASRNDQSGMSDPIISAMLSNLGLQSTGGQMGQHTAQQTGQALNILNSLTGFAPPNPLMQVGVGAHVNLNVAPPNLGPNMNLGQGLLGPAPGHMGDFNQMNHLNPIAFDPRVGLDPRNQSLDPRNQGLDPRNQGLDPRTQGMDPRNVGMDPRNQGPGILGNPPFGDFQGGNNLSDDEDYMYDNGQYPMYNPNNHQQRGQNRDNRNNRRGRNNNNNRNRNQFFRHQNRNNRNRNSPS